jgi:lipocalin-like protein
VIRRKTFRNFLNRLALPAILVATLSPAAHAQEQAQESAPDPQLIGTWTLLAVDNVLPDGSRIHLYGPNPHGLLIFDAHGHYALQIMSDGRPKFAANDKSKGTPEEYRAAIQGTNCHYGRYTINADRSVTLHVEEATFANWEGADLTWPFTVAGDESKFVVPHPTTGGPGVIGEIVFKRVR